MMKVAFLVSTLAVTAHSATKVAVLEFGKSGVVRRTTSTRTVTTFSGVVSFLGALHGQRQLQQAGMPLVPDLFNKPDHALIVGISGVDLASMPALSNIVENQAVGHMDVDGSHCNGMLNKFGPPQETSVNNLVVDAKAKLTETGLKSMSLTVTDSDAAAVEAQIQTLIASLKEQSTDGKSRVVHFVLEEKDGESHRRLDSRELASASSGYYYGYGYYNDYGIWVTPYKTMFQIQYFNVVLWTSIVLVFVLISTIYMMIDMPMEADTLLFGESAKMMAE